MPDVDEAVGEVAGWITPRLGGVGPTTIAMLLTNTVEAAERRASWRGGARYPRRRASATRERSGERPDRPSAATPPCVGRARPTRKGFVTAEPRLPCRGHVPALRRACRSERRAVRDVRVLARRGRRPSGRLLARHVVVERRGVRGRLPHHARDRRGHALVGPRRTEKRTAPHGTRRSRSSTASCASPTTRSSRSSRATAPASTSGPPRSSCSTRPRRSTARRSSGRRCSPGRRRSTRRATGCPRRPSRRSASTSSASRAR